MFEVRGSATHRILVVDESPLRRTRLSELLRGLSSRPAEGAAEADEAYGYRCEVLVDDVSTIDQASAALGRALTIDAAPAMAFVDADHLGEGGDGVELLAVQRLWALDPGLPVALVTSEDGPSPGDLARALDPRRLWWVLRRPLIPATVLALICAHGRRQTTRSGRTAAPSVVAAAGPRTSEQLRARQNNERQLQGIGQMLAGVAHELNTPAQYVGDNIRFVSDGVSALMSVIEAFREVPLPVGVDGAPHPLTARIAAVQDEADLEYLEEELPLAIAGAVEGVERISSTVRAMKTFAHPDGEQKDLSDLNNVIQGAAAMARSEYKHVAYLDLQLGNLPQVPCFPGAMGSVLLNLIVNAAHAIQDRLGESDSLGLIVVRSRRVGSDVEITVTDDGAGIDESQLARIYEAAFTTKSRGRGTGQGLAIAHDVVVKQHGGDIDCDSRLGEGTTFRVRLPLYAESDARSASMRAL
jgi:signal transduction histidine kinase